MDLVSMLFHYIAYLLQHLENTGAYTNTVEGHAK